MDATTDACPHEEELIHDLFQSALQRIPVVEVVVEPAGSAADIALAALTLLIGVSELASDVEMRSQHLFVTIVQSLKQ